jgi:hypothetical protein
MTALRQIPVRMAGDWLPVADAGPLDWHGTATADEPITALALIRTESETHWSRVGHAGAAELSIKLSVRPGVRATRDDVYIWLTVLPTSVLGGSGIAHVQAHVPFASAAPFMFSLDDITTGVASWFARPWVAKDVRLGALFVAEADTRSARNHLWHLRKGIVGPDEPLTAALAYGRSGTF